MDKLYTIIIPHHTKGDTRQLERAVASIPERDDIQVIVVDNSPKPISKELFRDRGNVSVLFSDPSKGAGHARNVGLKEAMGTWTLFLDADDYFVSTAFEALDRNSKGNYDVIFFNTTSVFDDTGEEAKRHLLFNKVIDNYIEKKDGMILRFGPNVPWGKMIRSSVIKEHHLEFEEVHVSNDAMFCALLGVATEKVAADESTLVCVTVSKGSLSNLESLDNLMTRFHVKMRCNAVLKKNNIPIRYSVARFIYESAHYGFKPFWHCFSTALKAGALTYGWKNWAKTLFTRIKNKKKLGKYNVKE